MKQAQTQDRLPITKARFASIAASVLAAIAGLSQPTLAEDSTAAGKERIGIYDSRAVPMAYGGTVLPKKIEELKSQHRKAKEAGDAKEVARLEAEGPAAQRAINKQGFGTAPVDDLLEHIAGELPKIKNAAGVSTLVSKWDTAELARHPKTEQVDVTMQLVDAFHPNAAARKNAIEIQRNNPVPLDQIDKR